MRVKELLDVWISFDLRVPFALPLHLRMVASPLEKIVFPESGLIEFLQGTVGMADGIVVAAD